MIWLYGTELNPFQICVY